MRYRLTIAESTLQLGLLGGSSLKLAPGQSLNLALHMNSSACNLESVSFYVTYKLCKNGLKPRKTDVYTAALTRRSIHEPHRITYSLPSSIVSYAILQPPRFRSSHEAQADVSLPILVALHGAGLQADSEQVRHMLDPAGNVPAWILFPSGVTSWSADDWREFCCFP